MTILGKCRHCAEEMIYGDIGPTSCQRCGKSSSDVPIRKLDYMEPEIKHDSRKPKRKGKWHGTRPGMLRSGNIGRQTARFLIGGRRNGRTLKTPNCKIHVEIDGSYFLKSKRKIHRLAARVMLRTIKKYIGDKYDACDLIRKIPPKDGCARNSQEIVPERFIRARRTILKESREAPKPGVMVS